MKEPRPWQVERARLAAEQLQREAAASGRRLSIGVVVTECGREFGVPVVRLLGEQRGQGVTVPRHAAMALAYRLAGRSLPAIGRAMNRDHSTVLSGIRRHAQREAADPVLAARVAALSTRLEERLKHA